MASVEQIVAKETRTPKLRCQADQYSLCSKIRPQQFFVGGPTNEDYPEKARKWRERSNGLSRLPFRPFLEKLNDEHSKKYPIPKSPTAGEIMKRICSYKAVDSTHTPSRAPQSHRAEFFCNLCREEGCRHSSDGAQLEEDAALSRTLMLLRLFNPAAECTGSWRGRLG